eukprot:6197220-Pleurochrysis_carterae.AAC.1
MKEKRKTAECWGGEEYLIEWDDGEQNWVNKREVDNMNGADAEFIFKARELIKEEHVTFAEHMIDLGINADLRSWGPTWREFLKYAQSGEKGKSAKENVGMDKHVEDVRRREPYPTLYPGELEGEDEGVTGHIRRNMKGLTDRAKDNLHKRETREDKYKNKRTRLAEGGSGVRRVSDRPGQRPGGLEWELPPLKEDTEARRLIGGRDGRGGQKVLKDEARNPAYEEEYAGHPILRLFTRPTEMEDGTYMSTTKEDITHMNTMSGKKLSHDTLN